MWSLVPLNYCRIIVITLEMFSLQLILAVVCMRAINFSCIYCAVMHWEVALIGSLQILITFQDLGVCDLCLEVVKSEKMVWLKYFNCMVWCFERKIGMQYVRETSFWNFICYYKKKVFLYRALRKFVYRKQTISYIKERDNHKIHGIHNLK